MMGGKDRNMREEINAAMNEMQQRGVNHKAILGTYACYSDSDPAEVTVSARWVTCLIGASAAWPCSPAQSLRASRMLSRTAESRHLPGTPQCTHQGSARGDRGGVSEESRVE